MNPRDRVRDRVKISRLGLRLGGGGVCPNHSMGQDLKVTATFRVRDTVRAAAGVEVEVTIKYQACLFHARLRRISTLLSMCVC